MDSVHHIWCPLSSQEYQDLPDGAETTLTHVAAVVDQNNKVLGTQYFSTTRQGYRQMLAWMTSFGTLKRIG
ncbi:hypothetical protein AB0134_27765, partial [Klebsiella pneumoniae]